MLCLSFWPCPEKVFLSLKIMGSYGAGMGKDQRYPTGRTDWPGSKELLRGITGICFNLEILPEKGSHQVILFSVIVHNPSSRKVSLVFKHHSTGLPYKDERNILSLTHIIPATHLPVLERWLSDFLLWSSNLRPSQDVLGLDPILLPAFKLEKGK